MEALTELQEAAWCCDHRQSAAIAAAGGGFMEMEHLFGKVATPSDVGKLNRLVIPKQYAQKYFPHLDSPTKKKGIVLNFEDPKGKSWRFRYSYWRSSQSYVITKGWSRFVKENTLHAGDLVCFGRANFRASGKSGSRLYIRCRRGHSNPGAVRTRFELHNCKYRSRSSAVSASAVSHKTKQQYDLNNMPLIIDSMNVVDHENYTKHFRLFGVDLEFCIPRDQ